MWSHGCRSLLLSMQESTVGGLTAAFDAATRGSMLGSRVDDGIKGRRARVTVVQQTSLVVLPEHPAGGGSASLQVT